MTYLIQVINILYNFLMSIHFNAIYPHLFYHSRNNYIFIHYFYRRMPSGITMVQTANDLFNPKFFQIRPKNHTFRPFIRLKKQKDHNCFFYLVLPTSLPFGVKHHISHAHNYCHISLYYLKTSFFTRS